MIDFNTYLRKIEKAFQSNLATEHTYRPFLQTFVESFGKDITAINEPKRRTFGAPDYVIRRREIPIGYIEAKDVGKDLDKLDKREKEQLKKYTDPLNNIIYTNYLDFRWYVRGEVVQTITLAEFDANGNLHPKEDAEIKLTNLIKEFLQKKVPTVATPKELAKRMASITRLIRQTIEKALEDETTSKENTLHDQFESYKKTLLPNLDDKGFADLYSQTIAYGLFTARCFDKEPPFTRQEAAYLVPKTNPFLRHTFDRIAGIHLDERIVWAVDDLAELLNRTDISAILQDFGKRTRQEDPVVHFYETFLAEYDPKLRETRGVYYTPEPVVSYIVRSVDKILQNDFGLPKGLADSSKLEDGSHRVLILDPATGTGTFLYNVIKTIFKRYERNKGMWDGYVSEHLLPRIFGFELLVAPYAVAHLKLAVCCSKKPATNSILTNACGFISITRSILPRSKKTPTHFPPLSTTKRKPGARFSRTNP
jgi:type I restriction-modification system DNA methylase subunit